MNNKQLKESIRGKIPWSLEGYKSAIQFAYDLPDKPLDDWDLREKKIEMEEETLLFNNYSLMNQLSFYLINLENGHAHFMRFMKMQGFLIENEGLLIHDGFAKREGEDVVYYKEGLLEILCTCEFTKKIVDREGCKDYDYDYDLVTSMAK